MQPRRSQRVNINGEGHDQSPIVLLVDDEAPVRDVLSWVIQGAGFTPVAAGGAEGFTLLTQLADRIALVLLDLTMHDMDGFKFRELQRAQARLADVPTVVMSGRPVLPEERVVLHANEYVWKPVRIAELRALITEHARALPSLPTHHHVASA
jgi:two-component system phosphate regulon response regulator PhoB